MKDNATTPILSEESLGGNEAGSGRVRVRVCKERTSAYAYERALNNLSRSKLKARLTEPHNAQLIALSVLILTSLKEGGD
jgi:hypothetical protein